MLDPLSVRSVGRASSSIGPSLFRRAFEQYTRRIAWLIALGVLGVTAVLGWRYRSARLAAAALLPRAHRGRVRAGGARTGAGPT